MDTCRVIDVQQLRLDAAARSAARPVTAFDGHVVDDMVLGVRVRHYRPSEARADAAPLVFLHGGYGLFGDLGLQDGHCRRLASNLARTTIAIDYPLAPEHSFDESVAAVTSVVHEVSGPGSAILCGDSAGGAVAVAAAKRLGRSATAMVLSNPNLDFTLSCFDLAQPAGPDPGLSRFAFTTWHRVAGLEQAPRLHVDAQGLPPALIAVGTNDSLAVEARALADSYQREGRRCRLIEFPDVGHGFIGDASVADSFLVHVRDFLDHTTGSK